MRKLLICSCLASLLLSSCSSGRKLAQAEGEEDYMYREMEEVTISARKEYHSSANRYFILTHTQLELKPIWATQQLQGKANIVLSPYAYPQDSLVLDAHSFDIQAIDIYENKDFRELKYRYDNKKIYIQLGQKYLPGDTLEIEIAYVANPQRQYIDSVITKKDEQGLYFINPLDSNPYKPRQLWSQGETRSNSAWFPTIDETNQKFSQEIRLTVDTQYTTLSNGALMYSSLNGDGTRTDVWEQEEPHAPYLAMIAAGNWKIIKDKWRDSIEVSYYLEPRFEPYARLIFGHTPEMIEYFSRILKYDYPWPKFAQLVARDFVSGAMENTGAVVHFEGLQHDARAHVDNTFEDIISHELFHHWFGDLVTCKNWANLTLNESFATYGSVLWDEYKYGTDEAQGQLLANYNDYMQEAAWNKEPIVNHYYNSPDDLFDRHRYEKGSLVIHMLRHELGDSIFFQALHNYLEAHAFGNAELAELRIACEEASGKDLTWFFRQWYEKPGHPKLNISHRYDAATQKQWLYVNQVQQEGKYPVFILPVEVDLYTAGLKKTYHIKIERRRDSFAFDAIKAPEVVIFDSEKYLLAEKDENKTIGQWYAQFFRSTLMLNKLEALRELAKVKKELSADSLEKLTATALQHPYYLIRALAINKILEDPSDRIKGEALSSDDNIMRSYRNRLEKLALQDPVAEVRKEALKYIMDTRQSWREEIYVKALQDSSYEIVSWALRNLLSAIPRKDSAKLIHMARPYAQYKDGNVGLAIAAIFAEYPSPFNIGHFHTLPYYLQTGQGTRFIIAYQDYMLKQEVPMLFDENNFINTLQYIATDGYARLLYKKMLNAFATRLSTYKGTDIPADRKQKMIDELLARAENIKLNFSN